MKDLALMILTFLVGFMGGGVFISKAHEKDIKNGIIKGRDSKLYKLTEIKE